MEVGVTKKAKDTDKFNKNIGNAEFALYTCSLWLSSIESLYLTLFNWVVCLPGLELCEFFYILEIKPLSEVSFSYIFSHTVGSLFILLMFSLAMQKLYNLMKSHLFILSFMSLVLGDISVKILLRGISEIFQTTQLKNGQRT